MKLLQLSNIGLRIIETLKSSESEDLYVEQIRKELDVDQSALSYHLRLMETAKILKCRKEGRRHYYQVNYEEIVESLDSIIGLFYGGQRSILTPSYKIERKK